MIFIRHYLDETAQIVRQLNASVIEQIVQILVQVRTDHGRIFILGVGGSAANASHAVNDFRKLAGLEAYAPTDNISELTARTNDDGWSSVFATWLQTSQIRQTDAVLVFSVGGGTPTISSNIVEALKVARAVNAWILGIVGRDGGATAQWADACVIVPTCNPAYLTPQAETLQAVVWHCLVSHPDLAISVPKWESLAHARCVSWH